jgi:hypothetical protein
MSKSETLAAQFMMLLTDYITIKGDPTNFADFEVAHKRLLDHVTKMIEYTGEDT